MNAGKMNAEKAGPVQPWWRIRMVWLAFGGPAAVVVASFVTLGFAIHGRDVPLRDTGAADADAHTAAEQARNHVAAPKR
jgi:hypothetical protein